MRYLLIIIIIGLSSTSCQRDRDEKVSRKFNSVQDSLNGTYIEVMSVKGVPIKMKYYEKYKPVMKAELNDGYLTDLMTVDSLGNTIKHMPIVVWKNPDAIKNLDTLRFEIRNVDSLTYYQYFYETSLIKFQLEEQTIHNQRPISIKDRPIIKIPAYELKSGQTIYLKCGVLISAKDSADIATHTWGYFENKFELK